MEQNKTKHIVDVENIHTYIENSHLIQGLSMYIERREAVSILGRNGVGKTTALRSIMGLVPPKSGRIVIKGQNTTAWLPHKISNLGVSYVPAERDIFPNLNVEENLQVAEKKGAQNRGWNLETIYEQFPILKDRRKQNGSTLSGGEQQTLAIARALMGNPEIIILDEPSQGLAPFMVKKVSNIIHYCIECGITLLIVEQNYRMALDIASRHYLMSNRGIIASTATSQELLDNPDVLHAHLTV